METWKDIPGYEGLYQVSTEGNIRSFVVSSDGRLMKFTTNSWGYSSIVLHKNRQRKNHVVHRLVAETFLPNPNCYPIVDHINGDRTDNRVDNLRWVDHNTNLDNRPAYRELLQEIQELKEYIAYLESRA